jgi:hypothetical protein
MQLAYVTVLAQYLSHTKYNIISNLNIFYKRKNNETNLKIEENKNTFHCDQRFQASSRT